jgi:hypothetical protein
LLFLPFGCQTTTTVVEPGYFKTISAAPTLVPVLNLGWNASAVSESTFIGDGQVSFQIQTALVGAVVGLTTTVQAPQSSGYQDMFHAFYIERGTYRIVEHNSFKTTPTPFTLGSTFRIIVVGGVVEYRVDNSTVYSAPSTLGTLDVSLDAVLYSAGDRIYNASLDNLVTTTANNTITTVIPGAQPNVVFGALTSFDVGDGSFNAVFGSTSEFDVQQIAATESTPVAPVIGVGAGQMSFETLTVVGSDGQYNAAQLSFESLEVAGNSGLTSINFGSGQLSFAPLLMDAGTYKTGFGQLSFEPLRLLGYEGTYSEGRTAFEPLQVNGFDIPDLELGVAQIAYTEPGKEGYGNATLLRSGRHLLTAAHVAVNFVDVGFVEVRFFAGTKFQIELIPVVNVLIHPEFEQQFNTANPPELVRMVNDLAIITLAEDAHPLIRRHDVYTGTNELGNTYTRLSFSPQLNPETGVIPGSEFDRWTLTNNKFEVFGEGIENLIPGFIPGPLGTLLGYDFDDGTTLHDAFSDQFSIAETGVFNEGFVQPGDSGSASFVGDGLIVGVTSYGVTLGSPADISAGTNYTYGEVALDVRVSAYANWISDNSGGVGAFESMTLEACLLLPEYAIEARATKGQTLTGGQLDLLEFDVEGSTGGVANLDLFELGIEASITQYALARANLLLPEYAIEAVAYNGAYAVADLLLPEFEIEGSTGAVANLEFYFDLDIEASSTVSAIARANLLLPEFEIEATGTISVQATVANLELPELEAVYGVARCLELIQFGTHNTFALTVVPVKAYAMNVLHAEITEYSNYTFDRIVRLHGDYYGIRQDGVYLLSGDDDNGVRINASFKTGRMDMGTAHLKRVPYVYMDSQDKTVIQPFVENVAIGKFDSNYEGRRTRLARGANGRFWAFKVNNVAGGKMDIRSLELYPNVLSRKVR